MGPFPQICRAFAEKHPKTVENGSFFSWKMILGRGFEAAERHTPIWKTYAHLLCASSLILLSTGNVPPKKPCFDIIAGITGKWKFKKKIFGRFLKIWNVVLKMILNLGLFFQGKRVPFSPKSFDFFQPAYGDCTVFPLFCRVSLSQPVGKSYTSDV